MPTKRRRSGVFAVVLLLLIAGAFGLHFQRSRAKQPEVRTAAVTRGDITTTVSATGTLQPLTTVDVKSNVGGQVVALNVDEGDRVKAGQVIARIDPSDTLTSLEQMQADLVSARSRVSQAKDGLTLLRRQNAAQLRSAEEAATAARLRLAQAETQAGLQAEQTENAIEQARQTVAAAKVRLAQAETQAKLQPRLTDTAIAQAKSNLDAARATHQQVKTALAPQKIAAAQAAFDQAAANDAYAGKDLARQQQLLAKGFVPRSQVEAAEQRQQVARAQLDTARQKLETVKAEAQEDIEAAKARLAQAEAGMQSAEANRTQDALKEQEVEAARASLKQAEAGLKQAEANRAQNALRADDVAAARAALKQAEAGLESARAARYQESVKSGDITQTRAQVTRSEASVANARTQLAYTTVTAPRDGVVMKKYVEVGSIVTAGRSSFSGTGAGVTLVEIADISRMFALVNVDETDIAQIRLGQEVAVTVDAFPKTRFTGEVTKISPKTVVDQNITTVPVTVEIASMDLRLKPGMNATCDFIIEKKTDVLLVPLSAVREAPGDGGGHGAPAKATVTVLQGEQQVTRRVETGVMDDEHAEIMRGVKEGERVVTEAVAPMPGRERSGGGRRRPGPF